MASSVLTLSYLIRPSAGNARLIVGRLATLLLLRVLHVYGWTSLLENRRHELAFTRDGDMDTNRKE